MTAYAVNEKGWGVTPEGRVVAFVRPCGCGCGEVIVTPWRPNGRGNLGHPREYRGNHRVRVYNRRERRADLPEDSRRAVARVRRGLGRSNGRPSEVVEHVLRLPRAGGETG